MARRARSLRRLRWWRHASPGAAPRGKGTTRLVLDRVEAGRALGWAHGPPGTSLFLDLGASRVTEWPRRIERPDVDAAVGDRATIKGFSIPLDPIAGLLALTPAPARPRASIAFGEERIALEAAAPDATMTTLGGPIADLWLCDARHLRIRTAGVGGARAVQIAGPPISAAARGGGPTILTLALHDPLAPVLLILDTQDGPVMDLIPFPSLLRGGIHRAETLATAGGDCGLAARATALARAMARTLAGERRTRITLARRPLAGAADDPAVYGFLAERADLREPSEAGAMHDAPGADAVPTIASLCEPAAGLVIVDPGPGGETWLLHPVSLPGLAKAMPEGGAPLPFAPPSDRRLSAPAVIRPGGPRDEGLDPLLYPLAPDIDFAEPAAFRALILPGGTVEDGPLRESLAPLPVTFVDPAGDLAALGAAGPVLFLDRAMLLHDRRTVAALQAMAALPGVASASPMVVTEPREGNRSAWDRVRSAGLFPIHAAADQPWRPAVGPLPVAPYLFRSAFLVAANTASCVMVTGEALAAHGAGLAVADPAALAQLMARCTAAGRHHAATTWFSVFDRGAADRPSPGPAFEALPPPGAVTLARRLA